MEAECSRRGQGPVGVTRAWGLRESEPTASCSTERPCKAACGSSRAAPMVLCHHARYRPVTGVRSFGVQVDDGWTEDSQVTRCFFK